MIDKNKEDIYKYGFEMLISNLVYMVIFIIFCILTNSLWQSLCFWMGLFLVRKTAGGHHANSYLSCHFLFAANHLILIALIKLLSERLHYFIILFMLCLSATLVFLLAPVDHKNKPFIKTEYKRYKLFSRICSIVLGIIFLLFVLQIIQSNNYLLGFSFGTFSATISLLCAKITRYKERKKDYEKLQELGV